MRFHHQELHLGPKVGRKGGTLDVRVPSSESASSMPPLEDARDLGDVIMDGSTSVLNQSYHDERVYQDHRSVHLHSVEPAAYEQMAQMAVQARVSDLRNEAQQVVTGVVSEAERAVRSAQSEASHANMRAEATHALANQVVEHLRRQLEQVMSENQELRARCCQQRPDPLNGAGMFTARMIAMEERNEGFGGSIEPTPHFHSRVVDATPTINCFPGSYPG